MSTRKRLFLIDGTALAYRSHFAFAGSRTGGLSTRDGKPTSATFGFTMTLRALLEREAPDLCAVAFDGPRAELERTAVYPEYKSTREKAPDEMLEQLDDIQRVAEVHGIQIVETPSGHEADDVIGTLAVQGREADMDVFIVTGDKDFMQLVDERVKLWSLRSSAGNPDIIGKKEVVAKFGVEPRQIIDLLALMGDSSDNVPGVPRVGQKTASTLLQTYDTLDQAYERLDDVKPPSVQKALRENRDQAMLSRDLVTIRLDVPVANTATELAAPEPDIEAMRALFLELEFERLAGALPSAEERNRDHDYRIVRDAEQLDAMLTELREAGRFAVDTETTSLDALAAKLVGLSFCCETARAWYVPLNATPPVLAGGADAVLEAVRPLLEDASLGKVGQNIKYDMHVLMNAGITLRGVDFDTMLASYCVSPGQGQHGLDSLALRYFNYKKIPTTDLLGKGKQQKTFDEVDVDLAGEYAAEDADFTWRLDERLRREVDELDVGGVLQELEIPLIDVLLGMEREGIAIDTAHLERLSKDFEIRIARIQERAYERAGEPFNLNSPAQIGKVLFEDLEVHKAANVKQPKKTKTGQFKTDAAILEKLAEHHEVPKLILDFRQLSKLKGTYIDALPELLNPKTGRIHTSFNQAVAATGRLSSDQPNLQNIPIRTAEGREVRKAFVPRADGWWLVSADYSQIELRILAHMADDKALKDAFQRDEDIHTRTAATVHGVMPELVTLELRSQAKAINYGLVYGMGPQRLANDTGMTLAEAKKFIAAYFKAFPGVKRYLDDTLERAREEKAVHTLYGRRRPLPDIDAKAPMLRVASENMAVNTPIQGTAADIMKRAMLAVAAALDERKLRARMLLQVHDELVLDVPDDELAEVELLLRDAMERAADLSVPLAVTLGHGKNWLEAH